MDWDYVVMAVTIFLIGTVLMLYARWRFKKSIAVELTAMIVFAVLLVGMTPFSMNAEEGMRGIHVAKQDMQHHSNSLLAAMDTVSTIVDENSAARVEMSPDAEEGEENAAATEDVSSFLEELYAQVQDVRQTAAIMDERCGLFSERLCGFPLESDEDGNLEAHVPAGNGHTHEPAPRMDLV